MSETTPETIIVVEAPKQSFFSKIPVKKTAVIAASAIAAVLVIGAALKSAQSEDLDVEETIETTEA